jgi:hypothetical protein
MKTFLLFLYGIFEDHEDVEFFCAEILGTSPAVKTVRFVIENNKNIIVIFESNLVKKELSEELHVILTNDIVKFYFLFERESIYSANLPVQMKDFIFKPKDDHTSLRIEYETPSTAEGRVMSSDLDLDVILEKIEQFGVESLTEDEKKFLDNFEN